MPKLIALRSMGRLRPGDEFEVNRTQARALKALGRAQDAPAASPADIERDTLRSQAEVLGVDVDGRWGVERLRHEIAAAAEPPESAALRYGRRDMRADEE